MCLDFTYISRQRLHGYVSTEKVVCIIPLLTENSLGYISSKTDCAESYIALIPVQFLEPVAKLCQRDMNRPIDRTRQHFYFLSHIEQHVFVLIGLPLAEFYRVCKSHKYVLCRITCKIHRVLGRRVRRCVGKLKIGEVIHLPVEMQQGRNSINSLIHTIISDYLRAEHISAVSEDKLDSHRRCTRIIACVAHRMDQ